MEWEMFRGSGCCFCGLGLVDPRAADPLVGDIHQFLTASTKRDADIAQRVTVKADSKGLMVLGAADIAQLVLRRLLESFYANSVEVREHREHSNMELLETRRKRM